MFQSTDQVFSLTFGTQARLAFHCASATTKFRPAGEYDSHPLMLRRTIPALPLHIVLLLVALFNALAGAPLHEARHIQALARSETTSAIAGDVDVYAATRSSASDVHSEETHTTALGA